MLVFARRRFADLQEGNVLWDPVPDINDCTAASSGVVSWCHTVQQATPKPPYPPGAVQVTPYHTCLAQVTRLTPVLCSAQVSVLVVSCGGVGAGVEEFEVVEGA